MKVKFMPRVHVDTPESLPFSTEIPVYVNMINRGQHLGNHNLIEVLNEARTRFLSSLGLDGFNVLGFGLINADLAVEYKSEAGYPETLRVEVGATDFHKHGCDFVYRVSALSDGRLVARAKTGMLLFDYSAKKLAEAPAGFRALFGASDQSVSDSIA